MHLDDPPKRYRPRHTEPRDSRDQPGQSDQRDQTDQRDQNNQRSTGQPYRAGTDRRDQYGTRSACHDDLVPSDSSPAGATDLDLQLELCPSGYRH